MRIWIVKYGESVPFAKTSMGHHFFRSGELTRRLAERGHEVTWWTGRFQHQTKRHLDVAGETIEILGTNSRVMLLESRGYPSNLSPLRIYDHWQIGRNFRRAIQRAPVPDVIVASLPIPQFVRAATEYAALHNVPVIVDVRDMWPEVIIDRLKSKLRIPVQWLFYSYDRDVRHCLSCATSVTAVAQMFLEWAQRKGNRSIKQCANDRVFRLASREVPRDPLRTAAIATIWRERGFVPGNGKKVFVWAGTLTDQKAIREFFEAQKLLSDRVRKSIQIVICGKGDLENEVKRISEEYDHIIYSGFVPRDEVQFLYDNGHFGLLLYDNTDNFRYHFPNKFGEYLMSGLSVITTIDGAMQLEYGGEGFLITLAPSKEDIAAALSSFAFAREDMSIQASAKAAFRRDFDSDVVYEEFCDHIERCGRHQRE